MKLKTNRSMLKMVLLSVITFGIYGLVIMSEISTDINTIASKHDNKKTMHYCLLFFLVGPITLEIGTLVWMHRIANRMGSELNRRGIPYHFSATDFWLWNVLGALIVVGPFIYMYKFCNAINLLAENYNTNGD